MADAVQQPPQHLVFLNFRGDELRHNFVSHLVKAMESSKINTFIDRKDGVAKDIVDIFKRIDEARIALTIFSERYTESKFCLNELVSIYQRKKEGRLFAFPIFYKLGAGTVKDQSGTFGDKFRQLARHNPQFAPKWKEALDNVSRGSIFLESMKKDESDFIDEIVKDVIGLLNEVDSMDSASTTIPSIRAAEQQSVPVSVASVGEMENAPPLFGIQQRLKQLTDKLQVEQLEKTRVVGVVGIPGIGKTTLAGELFRELKGEFVHHALLQDIRTTSQTYVLDERRLARELLNCNAPQTWTEMDEPENWKDRLLETKILIVLDDVSDQKQIEILLGERDWIKEGSQIVITSNDKSVIEGLVDDIYIVPGLEDRDGLNHLSHYAFSNHSCPPNGPFKIMARKLVDYAKGNPLALKVLGGELLGKDETHWESKLGTLSQSPHKAIQDIFRISYDDLNEQQKDMFLDIACFFRSEDEHYVRSLLESETSSAGDLGQLANKFLINVTGGQVEMHDLLCMFARQIASQETIDDTLTKEPKAGWRRLSSFQKFSSMLTKRADASKVRGLFIDLTEVPEAKSFSNNTFSRMLNLRYLKLYCSCCRPVCDADCKIKFPDGLSLPLEEVRYLHWLNFPMRELPSNFIPKSLIDLKLPYSKIEQVWNGEKEALKLKWVDLDHSRKLNSLTGLLGARNLMSLNVEGCIALKVLPKRMSEMRSLGFLNLRGCTSLVSLPDMKLSSLKTLILSDCSKLKKFVVISLNLETLHLDGTRITELPSTIGDLHRLTLLNMRNCKALTVLPDCIGEMKALRELILSGCSRVERFPEVKEHMSCLEILLLDGTAINQMPTLPMLRNSVREISLYERTRCVNGITSLRRLCLSRNDQIIGLEAHISQLYHLRWLDLKYCKNLKSIPTLPPNLQCLDAHGCDKLVTVANPLSLVMPTERNTFSFLFTNCNNLDQAAKNSIISFVRQKTQMISDSLHRYDVGFGMEALSGTCFPGCAVPSYFSQREVGSVLETKLPPHLCDNRFTGIVLCAVVTFQDYPNQTNSVSVKCNCEFRSEDGSHIRFSCMVGGWTEPGDEPHKIESDQVFIGYNNCSRILKKSGANQRSRNCMLTEASFEFKVTDGTSEVVRGEVLKCGFSLVYAEPKNATCEVTISSVTAPWAPLVRGGIIVLTTFFLIVCYSVQVYLTANIKHCSWDHQTRSLG